MAEQLAGEGNEGSGYAHEPPKSSTELALSNRKEKRKALKKEKRKQKRKELAAKERQEEEARLNDPEELRRIQLEEERENERLERERKEYEEHERLFLETLAEKRKSEEEEEERRRALEEEEIKQNQAEHEHECDDGWEYIEEGPPEIIWQGNEIIVKKKKVKVKKKDEDLQMKKQSSSRPTSNPLPPQSEGLNDYNSGSVPSAQQLLEKATEQIPNFGTELDKTHCPFHLKTGACRFGLRCSRVHFYPDKSCTLLIKNMYNGPGLAWEQDEGLEILLEIHNEGGSCFGLVGLEIKDNSNFLFAGHFLIIWHQRASDDYLTPEAWLGRNNEFCYADAVDTYSLFTKKMTLLCAENRSEYMDDEVERCYEEFYEDVHTEFLKFGEIVNFKVSKNGSFHLRGNVYVHYKSVDSAVLAYQSINGRYFAGKQVSLEFVGVTKWKVAICGEFMKSKLKTCTRGTACNFIHCFRNPGGDYEWADWDKPPPKYWSMKMAALFGYPEEYRHDSQMEKEHRKSMTSDADRSRSRRTRSRERDSSRNRHEKSDACSRHHGHNTSWSRKSIGIRDQNRGNFETNRKKMDTSDDSDLDRDLSRRDSRGADRHRNTTKKKTRNRVEESEIQDSHEDNGSESDCDRYWLNRNKNHNSTREMSSHQKEEHEVRVEYVRKRTHSTSSSRNLSSKDRHRDVYSEESKKSYGYRSKDQQYHDDYGNSRKKTRERDSRDEGFDRYDGRSRKHDGARDEELSLVDAGAHAISKTDEYHIAESDSAELESERAKNRHKLSRWDPSEDIFSADLLETNRHDETKYSSPREGTSKSYYSRSKCSEIMDKGGALESGSRISGKHDKLPKDCSDGSSHRSKSHDSESLSDRDLKKGRRSSDKRYPLEHHISRKRSSPADFDQSVGNSSTHEQSSEEFCIERSTPIVRRRRGNRESSDGSEGVGSVEEHEESIEKRRHRHNRKHRTQSHQGCIVREVRND